MSKYFANTLNTLILQRHQKTRYIDGDLLLGSKIDTWYRLKIIEFKFSDRHVENHISSGRV